jgi:ketosteroid isomerase-like protein
MKTLILSGFIVSILFSCNAPKKEEPVKEETPAVAVVQKPVEIGDEKYVSVVKDIMDKLASGDVDAFLNVYADDAVYRWNNGDSLAGKPAIVKYWSDRRKNVITKLKFSEQIWLPVTVTEASTNNVQKGDWVLAWYTTDATYKSGKSMRQAMHMVFHFNSAGKVDEVIHYLDRGMVASAVGK